jgi:hypothetical protein
VVFRKVLEPVVQRGLLNTGGSDPMTSLGVWFVLFGVVLFICGLCITALERASSDPMPKSIGWCLLALAVLGVVLMPASGFWLIFPPCIAILLKKSHPQLAKAIT